jgi:hypothetical protein
MMGFYFGKQLKDFGVVTEVDQGMACVKATTLGAKVTDVYWVSRRNLEVGDKVTVCWVATASGGWYEADKYKEII